jgi:hypothetical protein
MRKGKSTDPLVRFLYILMRDHVTSGRVEEIMEKHVEGMEGWTQFTNGLLMEMSQDVAKRLRQGRKKKP